MTNGKVLAAVAALTFALEAQASARQQPSPPTAEPASQTQPAVQQPAPMFRSTVDLVSVAAVVRDRRGRFVKDLARRDFEVVEAGQRRPIVDFRSEIDGPIKVAILLDISGSMRVGDRTADARQTASHIFSTLAPADQAAIYTFDTALTEAQPFTSSRPELARAIDTAEKPFGQTSLYDAIAQTARAVTQASSGAAGLPQRSAVVVITDGIDTRSNMKPAEVSVAASGIDVPVYIVAVMATVDDPRETNHERSVAVASDLQELARGTGGELFIASAPAHASVAARQMIDELRHQYVLAFEASSQQGWRPLEVRTRQASLVVRARTGYSGGSPMSSGSTVPANPAAPATSITIGTAPAAAPARTSRRSTLAGR